MTTPDRWRLALVPVDASVEDAIRALNDGALQIALVVSGGNLLEGTITDGDVRRGLLHGLTLASPVRDIMHREALVVTEAVSREAALDLMSANNVRHLPIVDGGRRLVGLHSWQELSASPTMENSVVLMAGGRGTRLLPLTEGCPKPLLPVHGRPILEHIIRRAKAEGFRRFLVAVHYLGGMIEDHFGDGSSLGVSIAYVREEAPLGTAGALSLIPRAPEAPLVVMNADVITDVRLADMLEFHCRHAAAATMAVRTHEWQHPFGVVHTAGLEVVGFEEKPVVRTHINAGVYVLDPQALTLLRRDESCDMPTLFARLQQQGKRTIAYPMHEPWLDVGRHDDFERAQSLNFSPEPSY